MDTEFNGFSLDAGGRLNLTSALHPHRAMIHSGNI